MSQSPGKQFSGSSINRQASALRRTKIRKNLLGKFGNHLTYNPGLVIKEDSQETQASGKKDGSPQGLGSSKTGNSSVKDLLTLYEDGSRDRLAMNYYGNENKIQLWQRKLYEPPTTAQNDHIEKLVAEEFSLETWCYEVANDTTEIHMVSYHLNEVPRPIVFMGHLTKLNLSWNNLTSIPYEIGLLANLTELNLSFNRLTSLPPELGQEVDRDPMGNVVQVSKFAVGGMLQLKFIDVSNNAIAEIPHTLSRLADLNSFAFDHNELKLLPEGMSRWFLLANFSPHQNLIERLPHEMCSMEALHSLNLSKNAISELPQNIGKLVNLTYLDCSFNRLCQLPASLSHLENLEVLLLIDNVLELLPKEIGNLKKLTELNLYHNLLEDLPLSMKDLKADLVDLDYNPLTSIPALIRDEGWSSIQAFLSSDLMKRRKIKLRDHAQTVGQGVMGRDVPKLVELQIKLEEKKRMEERLAKAHKFDDTDFDVLKKAKQLFSKQVRTPKINDSTWLLFEGEKKFEKPNRKQRQTAINRALFEVAANEAKDE